MKLNYKGCVIEFETYYANGAGYQCISCKTSINGMHLKKLGNIYPMYLLFFKKSDKRYNLDSKKTKDKLIQACKDFIDLHSINNK